MMISQKMMLDNEKNEKLENKGFSRGLMMIFSILKDIPLKSLDIEREKDLNSFYNIFCNETDGNNKKDYTLTKEENQTEVKIKELS